MNSTKQIYLDILKTISEVRGEPIEKLSLETTINTDLGVYGDDWDDLILPIMGKYPITDFSDFVFLDHMSGEGYQAPLFIADLFMFIPKLIVTIIVFPFNRVLSKNIFQYRPYKEVRSKSNPLYIADILNSIIKGKWEYTKYSELDLRALIQ